MSQIYITLASTPHKGRNFENLIKRARQFTQKELSPMEKPKKWVPAFALILIALICSIAATRMPWWSVETTLGADLVRNSTAKAEYWLVQSVKATMSEDNKTATVTVPFSNLKAEDADKDALASIFNNSLMLTFGGLTLTALALFLILISGLCKPLFAFSTVTAAVAAILLLIAPLYLTFSSPPIMMKFGEVMPLKIPSSWVSFRPEEISSFWGSTAIPESPSFPEWSWNAAFWNWGAAFGWYMAFTASLFLFIASAWIYATVAKKSASPQFEET